MKIRSIIDGIDTSASSAWVEEAEILIRKELETAWLRGFQFRAVSEGLNEDAEQLAADYAERIVGGSTRPERPEVER